MIYVCYDIHDDKTRTKFSKLLKKYGRRIQYSVFEIKNSQRILNIVLREIDEVYSKKFTGADSIVLIPFSKADSGKIIRYGQPSLEEQELLFL